MLLQRSRSLFSQIVGRQPPSAEAEPILGQSISRRERGIPKPHGNFIKVYRIFCSYLWLLPWAFSIGLFLVVYWRIGYFLLLQDKDAIYKASIDALTWVSFPHVPDLPPPIGLPADFDIEAELQGSKMRCGVEDSPESLASKLENAHLIKEAPDFFGPVEVDGDPMYRQRVRVVPLPDFDYILVPKNTNQETVHRGGVSIFPSALISDHSVFACGILFHPNQCESEDKGSTAKQVVHKWIFSNIPIRISDPIVFIAQVWGMGYFHFLIENFMRMALVHEYLLANEHVKILSYEVGGADTNALFSLIGINPSRVISYSESSLYHANSSVIVPSGTACFRGQSRAIQKLRAIMRSNLLREFHNDTRYDIVLHQRGTHRGRYFVNHDELEAALKKAFPQYSLAVSPQGDVNAITTARMHLHAKLIIGPHGAGGSNIIFAEDGASLIEIHPNVGVGFVNGPHRRSQCNEWVTNQLHGRAIQIIANDGIHWHGPTTAPIDEIIRHARELLHSSPGTVYDRLGLRLSS